MRTLFYVVIVLVIVTFSACSEKIEEKNAMLSSDELEYQKQKDMKTIEVLKANQSDLSKPHLIEHHFITFSKENGNALLNWGKQNGFKPSELIEGKYEGKRYFYFDLIRPTIPSIKNIFGDTSTMLRLAIEFDCEYDGWGCEVVE